MPVGAVLGAIAAPLVGSLAGKVLGPSRGGAQANVPADVAGLRSRQISLISQLLGGANPGQNIANFYGGFTNDMQRSAANSLQNYVGMQRPEQRTLEALNPLFQRNLAAANQSGGRFGSANALMRGKAIEDFNILGANISQQAQQNQIQASNILGMLGNQEVANRIGAINNLFQTANSMGFNVPITTSPSGAQQGAQFGGQIGAGIMQALPYLFPGQFGGMPAYGQAAGGVQMGNDISQFYGPPAISYLAPQGGRPPVLR